MKNWRKKLAMALAVVVFGTVCTASLAGCSGMILGQILGALEDKDNSNKKPDTQEKQRQRTRRFWKRRTFSSR